MSQSIKVDLYAFQKSISQIISLKSNLTVTKITPPDIKSTSLVFTEYEEATAIYITMQKTLINLMGNTITFMMNTMDAYAKEDKTAAAKMGS